MNARVRGIVVLMFVFALAGWTADPTEPEKKMTELQGRVVCLSEEMQRLHRAELPSKHVHQFGFKTNSGKYYSLLRGKHSEALFVDGEVQKKELILKGRVFPETQLFEVTLWRSIREGVIHELFYWCNICSIRSMDPGICMCCQQPVELKEQPL